MKCEDCIEQLRKYCRYAYSDDRGDWCADPQNDFDGLCSCECCELKIMRPFYLACIHENDLKGKRVDQLHDA